MLGLEFTPFRLLENVFGYVAVVWDADPLSSLHNIHRYRIN